METDPLDEAITRLNLAEAQLSALEGDEPGFSRRQVLQEISSDVRRARMIVEDQR